MLLRLCLLFLPFLLFATTPKNVVCACEDANGWPPYTYIDKQNKIKGYSVDVLKRIFKEQNLDVEVKFLPWKRCLIHVKTGQECQIVLSATKSEERKNEYLFSNSYYATTPYYFYSKKHNPNGLDIASKKALEKYRVGVRLGFNYQNFELSYEKLFRSSRIDEYSFESLISKMHSNKFDMFVEGFEVIAGYSLTRNDLLSDKDLGFAPLTYLKPSKFYMLFPKNAEGAFLQKLINQGLKELKEKGALHKLQGKYLKKQLNVQ